MSLQRAMFDTIGGARNSGRHTHRWLLIASLLLDAAAICIAEFPGSEVLANATPSIEVTTAYWPIDPTITLEALAPPPPPPPAPPNSRALTQETVCGIAPPVDPSIREEPFTFAGTAQDRVRWGHGTHGEVGLSPGIRRLERPAYPERARGDADCSALIDVDLDGRPTLVTVWGCPHPFSDTLLEALVAARFWPPRVSRATQPTTHWRGFQFREEERP